MKELGLAIEGGLLLGCLWSLLAIALGVAIVNLVRGWRIWRSKRHAAALTLVAVVATIVGGSKHGMVAVNDPYITDSGSYVTNDYVHISISARYDFIPQDMEILIWSRTLQQTNAADWVQVVRPEEGPFKLREFPLDLQWPHATNYNFMVAANYIPEPTVHTNGVWQIKGFLIPGEGGKAAFPNTRIITKGDGQ